MSTLHDLNKQIGKLLIKQNDIEAFKQEAFLMLDSYEVKPEVCFEIESSIGTDKIAEVTVDNDKSIIRLFPTNISRNLGLNYLRLIIIHEIIHLFVSELYKKNGRDLYGQDEMINGGHPRLFFELLNNFSWNEDERDLFHRRHEIPYAYGEDDSPFMRGESDPLLICFSRK